MEMSKATTITRTPMTSKKKVKHGKMVGGREIEREMKETLVRGRDLWETNLTIPDYIQKRLKPDVCVCVYVYMYIRI